MKVNNIKNNKKGINLNIELILYIVLVIVMGVVIYFSSVSVDSALKDQDYDIEISYKFPAVFINSFLHTPLNTKQKTDLNLDPSSNIYVKDILKIDNTDANKIVNEIKVKYISDYSDSLDSYYRFADINNIDIDDLLYVERVGIKINANLLEAIEEDDNYYFYFRDNNNQIVQIYFKNPQGKSYTSNYAITYNGP